MQFTVPEILSLLGVAQCVYVLVYMFFHAGEWKRAILPSLYFTIFAFAFFLDFAWRFIHEAIPHYDIAQWALWFYGPPLSSLLVIQVAQITKVPSKRYYWVLWLPPIAFFMALIFTGWCSSCFR